MDLPILTQLFLFAGPVVAKHVAAGNKEDDSRFSVHDFIFITTKMIIGAVSVHCYITEMPHGLTESN